MDKYTTVPVQEQKLRQFFIRHQRNGATMLMAAKATGIERASVCRYIAVFERKNIVNFHGFHLCPISGHRAGFYSIKK